MCILFFHLAWMCFGSNFRGRVSRSSAECALLLDPENHCFFLRRSIAFYLSKKCATFHWSKKNTNNICWFPISKNPWKPKFHDGHFKNIRFDASVFILYMYIFELKGILKKAEKKTVLALVIRRYNHHFLCCTIFTIYNTDPWFFLLFLGAI